MTSEHNAKKNNGSIPYIIGGSIVLPVSLLLGIGVAAVTAKNTIDAHEKAISCIEKKITDNDAKDGLQQESIVRTAVLLEQISLDIKEIKDSIKIGDQYGRRN